VSEPAPDPLETSLLFDVFAVGQSVSRLLAAAMRAGPLTPSEYAIYTAIFELEAASPTAIAARLGVRLTTFMDQLRVVMERGHASRVGNPQDRRSYRVVLTTAGLAAHREANRAFEAAHAAFIRELAADDPDAELAAKRALAAIRGAAERARERTAPAPGAAAPAPGDAGAGREARSVSRPRSADRAG
jgi:DNA-binding MarR family transcriptional regulator